MKWIFLCFLSIHCFYMNAQESAYKWWIPTQHDFHVIEGQAWPDEVQARYGRLPAKAGATLNEVVFLMGLLPRKDYEKRIATLNLQIARLAEDTKVEFADMGSVFLNEEQKIQESLFSDGLHPNAAGYRKLKAALKPVIITSCNTATNNEVEIGSATAINVKDFGAIPDDNINDADALRAAVKACQDKGVTTLTIPSGQYLLADDKAIELQNDVFSGKYNSDVQGPLFNKHYKYVIGLDFKGIKNLTIEASGAELLCDGWMEPVSLVETENITINGLAIDYKRPPNNAGRIIKLGKDWIDVKFFDWCPVRDAMYFPRLMIYDEEKQLFTTVELGGNKGKLVDPQILRFSLPPESISEIKEGHIFWSIQSFHFRPAILLYKAKNTTLNDVSIFAQPGMGIVGHLSEDIILNRLKIVPKNENRYISSNTDATHFASNYGKIEFNDCDFAGQGDDATNVHNYYMTITQKNAENQLGWIPINMDLHSQKPEIPRVGDTLAVVQSNTLQEAGQIEVTKIVSVNPENYEVLFAYKGDFNFDIGSHKLANVSALPKLVFKNSRITAHRARSVLCRTRGVLIENNSFYGSTITALFIGAEGGWNEGVASQDVVIRNNSFTNTGWTEGVDDASAITIGVFTEQRMPYVISVHGAEDVTIRNNTFSKIGQVVLQVEFSSRIQAIGNDGLKDYSSQDGEPKLPINSKQ